MSMLRSTLLYSALAAITLIAVGPLLWLLVSSFKPTAQIISDPLAMPTEVFLGNYQTLNDTQFWTFYINSVLVTAGALIAIGVIGTPLAYGLARFSFTGRDALAWAVFAAILLPPALVVIPLYRLMQDYGLTDTHLGLILAYVAFALPLSVFILRAFFLRIPGVLADAARIDGATEFQLFLRVMLPLAYPALTAVLILQGVLLLSEFVLSLVLLQTTGNRTLPVGLTLLSTEYRQNVGALAAALVMSAVPVLLLYGAFSERFIKGMTAGAIKG
jgi:raffinose/stachyose/melibiose transport system permease protein